MEEKRNFTFTMSAELREAITKLAEIEDRSLSKLAEYLMWAGFDLYCKEKRLLSPFEVKSLSESFRVLLEQAGLTSNSAPGIEGGSITVPVYNTVDEKQAGRKKKKGNG